MDKCKRLKVLSFAKFQAILASLIGLVMGIVYSFGGLIADLLVSAQITTSTETSGISYGTVLAFGALLGMPILFALAGFAFALLEAFLFNLLAKYFGGIKIDFLPH